jgi:hypothetical protein
MKESKKNQNVADKKKEGEIEVNLDSLSLESDDELTFSPLGNDETDEMTEFLFQRLENGKGVDVLDVIKNGANLWAKRVGGNFNDSYPIHISAYNLESIDEILQSFSDPSERKKYMLLEDDEGNNLLDILLKTNHDFYGTEDHIKNMLSYLQPEEQM